MRQRTQTAATVVGAPVLADVVGRMVVRPFQTAALAAQGIVAGIRLLATPPRSSGRYADVLDPAVRFESERVRQGVSPRQVAALEQAIWKSFAAWFVGASLLLALSLLFGARLSWYSHLGLLAGPLACAALCAEKAFWHYQVRRRSSDTVGTWLRSPAEWFPPSEPGTGRAIVGGAIGILALVLTVPTVAFAAVAPAATADVAQQILTALFGSSGVSGQGTAATAAIKAMSATLMLAGAGMLTYHVVIGATETAMDGVPLGKRVHQAWAPVQLCFGMAMLAPMPSGLSGMHQLVYVVASQGSTLANTVWSTFVTSALTNSTTAIVPGLGLPNSIGGLQLAHEVLDAELCQQVETEAAPYVGATNSPAPPAAGVTGTASTTWDYGDCGSITIPTSAVVASGAAGASDVQAFATARVSALSSVISRIRGGALLNSLYLGSIAGSDSRPWPTSPKSPQLDGIAATYEAAMNKAASTFLSARDADVNTKLQANATWMNAGLYWRTLAQAGDQLVALASEHPDVEPPDVAKSDWSPIGPSSAQEEAGSAVAHLDADWKAENASNQLTADDLATIGDRGSNLFVRFTGPIMRPITAALVNLASADPTDPERSLQSLGSTLSLAGGTGMIAGAGLAVASGNIVSSSAGGKAAFDWVSGWAKYLIDGCIVLGWFLSYFIPMMPYIAVLWLSVGWVLFLAEAMIAAPVYAFMFVRMDASAFISEAQKPGVVLLFNLFFRPVFGILGLCLAFYVLPIMMSMLTTNFAAAYIGQQGGYTVGPFGILGGIALYVYLQIQVCGRALELVHAIPDKLPRWIGMSLEGSGESVRQGGQQVFAAAGRHPGAAAPVSGVKGGGGGGSAPSSPAPAAAG